MLFQCTCTLNVFIINCGFSIQHHCFNANFGPAQFIQLACVSRYKLYISNKTCNVKTIHTQKIEISYLPLTESSLYTSASYSVWFVKSSIRYIIVLLSLHHILHISFIISRDSIVGLISKLSLVLCFTSAFLFTSNFCDHLIIPQTSQKQG